MGKQSKVNVTIEPLLVDSGTAAGLLGVSKRHFLGLETAGKIGPMPVMLGRRKLFDVEELRAWISAGCETREKWIQCKESDDANG